MAFPQIFQTKRDAGGAWLDTLPVSNNMHTVTLDAATAASVVTPGSVSNWAVRFNMLSTAVIWMSTTATAAVPAGATLASSGSTLLIPGRMYYIPSGTTISVISPNATTYLGIEMYAINEL
jgi:hypothetical protein